MPREPADADAVTCALLLAVFKVALTVADPLDRLKLLDENDPKTSSVVNPMVGLSLILLKKRSVAIIEIGKPTPAVLAVLTPVLPPWAVLPGEWTSLSTRTSRECV